MNGEKYSVCVGIVSFSDLVASAHGLMNEALFMTKDDCITISCLCPSEMTNLFLFFFLILGLHVFLE